MLTPIDIREKEFDKGRGYTREVRTFLSKVAGEYEVLYSKNAELTDRISQLEALLSNYQKIEESMNNALVMAQKTADNKIDTANKEAEAILNNAKIKAEKLWIESLDKNNRIKLANKALLDRYEIYKKQLSDILAQQLEIINNIEINFNPEDTNVDLDDLDSKIDNDNYSSVVDNDDSSEYLDDDYSDYDDLDDLENLDGYEDFDDFDDELDDFDLYDDYDDLGEYEKSTNK